MTDSAQSLSLRAVRDKESKGQVLLALTAEEYTHKVLQQALILRLEGLIPEVAFSDYLMNHANIKVYLCVHFRRTGVVPARHQMRSQLVIR